MEEWMRVDSETRGDVVIVTVVAPRLDAAVSVAFVQAMATALGGARRAVVDLGRVAFVDSTALGALVGIRKGMGDDGTMAVAAAQPAVRNLFRLTRLDTVFPLFDTVEAAVEVQAPA
jgi:anti-sigma B factor antagonist